MGNIITVLALCMSITSTSTAVNMTEFNSIKEPIAIVETKVVVNETTSIELTKEEAVRKVNKYGEAYKNLVAIDDDVDCYLIAGSESLNTMHLPWRINTKDGKPFASNVGFAILVNYYNDLVNKNLPNYNISQYGINNNSADIMKIFPENFDLLAKNEVLLLEAQKYNLHIFVRSDLAYGNLNKVEQSQYNVIGHKVVYELEIETTVKVISEDSNTKNQFKALFDENGNLLNIVCLNPNFQPKLTYTVTIGL